MKRYIFQLAIQGYGNDPETAWNDAVESFIQDPGSTPDTFEVEDDDPEEDERIDSENRYSQEMEERGDARRKYDE